MDWSSARALCEVLFIIHSAACLSEIPSPQRVKVNLSVLIWDRPKNYTNITYAVQSNTTLSDWRDVYTGPQQQFNFTAAAEDFYGKKFRVQAKKGNQTSKWVESRLVQCAHLHTCAPVIQLKVERDMVHLWMKHRDSSLKANEGGHIEFRPLYWKRNSTNDKQEPGFNSDYLLIRDLEPGQEYCFQVEYLLFHKPHGKPSREICAVIPETSKQRSLRFVMYGVLVVVLLAILGGFLYFVHTHYKRIKALLQPPLDIPEHIQEFIFRELPEFPLPERQVTESYDLVSYVEEVAEDQDRYNLENAREHVCST
ncbi:interferon gamma receptor 2 [Clarias gariepinus]